MSAVLAKAAAQLNSIKQKRALRLSFNAYLTKSKSARKLSG